MVTVKETENDDTKQHIGIVHYNETTEQKGHT
jgi:hypothetical protein